MRREFKEFDFTEFEIIALENEAPAIWETSGTAVVNGDSAYASPSGV